MNRIGRVSLVVAAVSVASLFAASAASADTFCAVTSGTLPDCTQANTEVGAGTAVTNALNAAFSHAGPDKVVIGSGTFTTPNNASFSYVSGGTPGNDVDIAGQGPSTVLQPLGNPAADYVLVLASTSSATNSVHDLKVNIPSTAGTNVTGIVVSINSPTDIHDVTVTAPTNQLGTIGISLGSPGSKVRSSTIDITRHGSQSGGTFGVVSNTTSTSNVPLVSNSNVSADFTIGAGTGFNNTDERIDVRGSRLTGNVGLFTAQAGHMTVQDSLIRLLPDVANLALQPTGLLAQIYSGGSGSAQITARHTTIVGGTANNDVGAKSSSSDPTANTDVLVRNSILADVETSLYRFTSNSVATLSAEYSDFNQATVTDSNTSGGAGIISLGDGNVNVTPGFVNSSGGDFSLAASSPLIDAGDPAALAGDEPTTDLAGNPRVVDGNGDGTARRDMGAFEYQPPPPTGDTTPPETIAGKFKRKAKAGKKAKFKFSSDDPAATFTCAYDDGSPKACTSPYTLKRLKRGKHTLTITAIDAAGNHDPTPVVDKFKVKKKKRKK